MIRLRFRIHLLITALVLVMATAEAAQQPDNSVGSVSVDMSAFGAGVGFGSGSGVLNYDEKQYPFKIEGLSVGSIGINSMNVVGKIYNMKNISDFAGDYTVTGTDIFLPGGAGGLVMQNQCGVIINIYATQQGVQLNISSQGLKISMP